ncbi:MAG: Rho termination factor N-terminal domain-containing protein, partial [Desulfobacterales bacterium]|nr:Rho termination factor N-terminal domain-containing protein [Desulfobacterales bacterium]
EAKEEPAEAKEEPVEAKEEPAEAKEEPAEAKEEPVEAKEEPTEAKEEPTEAKEKPVEAKGKPLEKMTVKELREMAKEIPGIAGVHAMKKEELIVAIQDAKGIKTAPVKKADATIAGLKQKIKAMKAERQAALEAKDRKMATIYKRRISRLKKKTRRAAA